MVTDAESFLEADVSWEVGCAADIGASGEGDDEQEEAPQRREGEPNGGSNAAGRSPRGGDFGKFFTLPPKLPSYGTRGPEPNVRMWNQKRDIVIERSAARGGPRSTPPY